MPKGAVSISEIFSRVHDHLQGLHWKCFVCGEENRGGLQLNIRLDGDRTLCNFTPTVEFQGPPGIAHSGITAAVLDEVMSQLVYARLQFAVTRKTEVTYRRPLRIGHTYQFSAEYVRENHRMLYLRAEARDSAGNQVARARGFFAPLDEEQAAKFLDKPSGA